MINRIVVLDTETTGMDPADGAALLEIAYVAVESPVREGKWVNVYHDAHMIQFDGIIPPEARAVHHIAPEDVTAESGAFNRDDIVHSILAAHEPGEIFAAHNAAFDRKFLPEFEEQWICTWRCAMHLIPDAPRHSNQVLRYYLGLEPDPELITGLAPHRALYDTAVTAELLKHLLTLAPPERLLELTTLPVLLTNCTFGKHKGTPWANVPKDYLRWIIGNGDFDVDVMHTARHHYL